MPGLGIEKVSVCLCVVTRQLVKSVFMSLEHTCTRRGWAGLHSEWSQCFCVWEEALFERCTLACFVVWPVVKLGFIIPVTSLVVSFSLKKKVVLPLYRDSCYSLFEIQRSA